jgi:branched-chain amino acid transport system substrate-binding protein
MNRRSFSVATASTFALGTSGAVAQSKAPYKIGATWPLTGPIAGFVAELLKGGQIAADEINKAGGINGRPLQIVAEDTAGTPPGGVAATRKLAQVDNVHVILSCLTPVCAVQIPLAEELKVPVLAPIETPGLFDKATYCFAHAPSWGVVLPVVLKDIKAKNLKRVYGLYLNNSLGSAQSPSVRAAVQSIGAEYGDSLLDVGQTDFRGTIERTVEFKADAIIIGQQGGTTENTAIRQLRERGSSALIYNLSQTFASSAVQKVIGPYSEGTIWGGINLDPRKAPAFVRAFKIANGSTTVPSPQAAETYDCIKMMAYAFSKAGESGEGIQRVFAGLKDFPSIFGGTVDMGENHRTIIKAIGLFQVKSGQLTQIA